MCNLIAFDERLEHSCYPFFIEFNLLTFAICVSSLQINTPLSYILFSFL